MSEIPDHGARVAAALRGSIAAQPQRAAVGCANDMLAVAESLAERGAFDADDLRARGCADTSGVALLVRVLPIGLTTPLDRPRVRRDAYRCASAAGADEGTAVVCVAAAFIAADLLRFDPATTAIRVRQSLLEDAPMALLERISLLEEGADVSGLESDPGAALQVALSALAWTSCAGVAAVLARLGETGRGDAGTLAAALAGAAAGHCDVPVGGLGERLDGLGAALAELALTPRG